MKESQVLLKLVSIGLGNEDVPVDDAGEWSGVDWNALLYLARKQGVAALAFDGINKIVSTGRLDLERSVFLEWARTAVKSEQIFTRQKSVLSSLASLYAESDIKMLILKGYGLAQNYPEPQHRLCSDIDVYLFGKHKEGDAAIKKKGICVRNDYHHHSVFEYEGVHIENHFDFLNIHSHNSNIPYERRLKSLSDTGYLPSDIPNAYIPSEDFNALFILRHTAAHFAAVEMVLRQVVDWGTFVAKYGDNVDWDSAVGFLRDAEMYDFLYSLNTICTDFLGFPVDGFPVLDGDPALARRVLDDMLDPKFDGTKPESGLIRILAFKLRRWKSNIWKRKVVYGDSQLSLFVTQLFSHLQKPKTFRI